MKRELIRVCPACEVGEHERCDHDECACKHFDEYAWGDDDPWPM